MSRERHEPHPAAAARRLGRVAAVLVAGGAGAVGVLFALLIWTDVEVPEPVGPGLVVAALGAALAGVCLGVWTFRRSEWGVAAAVCGGLFLLGSPVWMFAIGVVAMNQDMRLHPQPKAAAPGPPPDPPPAPPGP